jgi:hypothetical protein
MPDIVNTGVMNTGSGNVVITNSTIGGSDGEDNTE